MTRRTRRRSGLTLLTLLAVQSVAAPLGACAAEQEHHEGVAHEAAAMDHTHGGDGTHGMTPGAADESHHAPDSTPADCLALAACGAPAMGARMATDQVVDTNHDAHALRSASEEPAAFVLGLTTPPPKI